MREHGDEDLLDHVVLPDDHFRQLVAHAVIGLLALLNGSDIVGVGGVGHQLHFNGRRDACPTLLPDGKLLHSNRRSQNSDGGALRSREGLFRGTWPGWRSARWGGAWQTTARVRI